MDRPVETATADEVVQDRRGGGLPHHGEAADGPVERLIDAAAAYLHFYLESPRQYAMIESAGAFQAGPGTEAARALIGERVARMNGALESIVAAAVEAGELRPLPPEPMTNFLRGTLNGVFALSSRPDALRIGHDQMREALRVGVELLLEASVADTLRGADGRLDPALCRRLREALADDPAPSRAHSRCLKENCCAM